ncbi:type VII secretion integral membrane protein EccD [Streptomyces sp. SM14]|uniref:type VII secretion integral membrane protein EccD n=1 Tax=Streptomyces sp. SM14 TaxID=1736045 RepID=UPI000CD58B41|nr:type VII secretion integral membrane protein EccD [Streptomyces sp. SM14]
MSVETWAHTSADRRVTVIGETRRADLSLSAEVPVGLMLPDVLRVLGEAPGHHPMARRLVTAAGREIPLGSSLAFAAVLDGAVLRLVREEELPAAPVVHDVSDAVADELPARRWRWGDRSRLWTSGVASVLLALAAALLAVDTFGTDPVVPWLAGTVLLVLASAVAALLTRRRETGAITLLTGAALGLVLIRQLALQHAWEAGHTLAAVTLLCATVLILLGRFTPLGRGGHLGAAALTATGGLWLAVGLLTGISTAEERAQLGTVLAVTAAFTVGLLPRLALTASGMTRLDDRHAAGTAASRTEVGTALDATHYGLALAVVITAVSGAAGCWLALGAWAGWTATIAALTAVVLLSRARMYPLAVSVVALVAAGTAVLVRLVLGWSATLGEEILPVLALGLLALAAVAFAAVRPAEHTRVRARRLATTAESLAVVALLPVAVGVFGVYGQLLDTF